MIVVRIHVLNQQLAIALDDIERRSQVMAKSALKCFEIFGLPSGRRAIRGHTLHERGQLDARAAHALEVRKHMIKLQPARILDDNVEKIGNGSGWSLHLLP